MELKEKLKEGNKRAIARLISSFENETPEGINAMKELYKETGKAHIVGITGPPGAGKSTLTDKLVKELRKQNKRVGIIAVDPASPFTGGAILGDRIRMNDLSTDPGVFIRSMGTRGALGGLSKAVNGAVDILDMTGVDYVFIETVGVGQSEIDIVKTADTVVVVTVPGLGDDIQAIKSGIMEIGHVFAVNKFDRPGGPATVKEIENVLEDKAHEAYIPPVASVISLEDVGISTLLDYIVAHKDYLETHNLIEIERKAKIQSEILTLAKEALVKKITAIDAETNMVATLVEAVYSKENDPYTAAELLLEKVYHVNK